MIGKQINHYKILEKLGAGGMGVVYKAEDTKLKRPVALKFLSQELTTDPEAVERLMTEAQTASALDHANVCTIYEIGETPAESGDAQMYISMAYYSGQTLKQKIEAGSIAVNEAIDIATQICQGLARAHEAGIMHRDIKPDNVMVTELGEIKILDFGLAKLASKSRLTQAGTMLGTMAYMSPEQFQNKPVDHRTDIWSLGVTIHEMLTGQLPFEGFYAEAMMYAVLNEEPQPLQSFRPELSSNLQVIIDRALQKKPAERYQAVREMLADLNGLSDASLTEAAPVVLTNRSTKINYLPDYEKDVFLSYSHIDDKALTEGQRGWISNFHQALEVRLEQLLGGEANIWRDDHLARKAAADGPSETPFPKAAILLSVVSPQYVKSPRCVQQVKDFYSIAEEDTGVWLGDKARIFKAVKTHVPSEAQPVELQSIPNYEFFRFDPVTGRPQEFWPELGAEANRNFWAKLEDIAYDIYLLVEALKDGANTSKHSGSVLQKPTVYLAETTHDLVSQRDVIKRQLQQHGYVILPDRPPLLNAADLKVQVATDLQRAAFSIHLIGTGYGIVPEGETRSISEIQHRMAAERSKEAAFSRLIWMPPGQQSEDERQKELVRWLKTGTSAEIGADLLETSLGEFKTFLTDKLLAAPASQSEPAVKEEILRIYLQCDQADLDATAPLEEYLFDQGFEVKLPAFEGDEVSVFDAHKQNLLLCDATIIYYGDSSDAWLSSKLADLQKIAGYGRSKPMKAKAVYLAAPETKHKLRFRTREAQTVKNFGDFSAELLTDFLGAVRGGG